MQKSRYKSHFDFSGNVSEHTFEQMLAATGYRYVGGGEGADSLFAYAPQSVVLGKEGNDTFRYRNVTSSPYGNTISLAGVEPEDVAVEFTEDTGDAALVIRETGERMEIRKGVFQPKITNSYGVHHVRFQDQSLTQEWGAFLAAFGREESIEYPGEEPEQEKVPFDPSGTLVRKDGTVYRNWAPAKPGDWVRINHVIQGYKCTTTVLSVLEDGSLVLRDEKTYRDGRKTTEERLYYATGFSPARYPREKDAAIEERTMTVSGKTLNCVATTSWGNTEVITDEIPFGDIVLSESRWGVDKKIEDFGFGAE